MFALDESVMGSRSPTAGWGVGIRGADTTSRPTSGETITVIAAPAVMLSGGFAHHPTSYTCIATGNSIPHVIPM